MHAIRFVDDLPGEHDFLFVEVPDGALLLCRRRAITPQVLEDAWAAYRAMIGTDGGPDRPEGRHRASLSLVSFG